MTKFSLILASAAVVVAEDAPKGETPEEIKPSRKCGDIDIDSLLEEVDMSDFDDLKGLSPNELKNLKEEFEKIKKELPNGLEGIGEKVDEVIDNVLNGGDSKNLRGRSLDDKTDTGTEETKPDDNMMKKKQFAAKCKANKGNVVDIDGFKFNAKDFIELVCDDDSKGVLKIVGKDRHGHPIFKKITKHTRIRCMKARFCRKPSMKKQGKVKFGKEFPASTTGQTCQDKGKGGSCDFQCENPNHVVKNFEKKNLTDEEKKELEDKTKEVGDKLKELEDKTDGSNVDDKTKQGMVDMETMMKEMEEKLRQQFGDLSEEEIKAKLEEMMKNKDTEKQVEDQMGGDAGEKMKEIINDNEDLDGKLKEVMENGEVADKLKETMKRPEGKWHKLHLFCDAKDDSDEEGVWRLGGEDGPIVDNEQIENMECGVEAESSDPSNNSSALTASLVFLGLVATMF